MISSLVRTAALVWRNAPLAAGVLCILTAIQGCVPAVRLWIGKLIVDAVVQGAGTGPDPFRRCAEYLLLLLAVTLLSNSLASASALVRTLLGETIANRISVEVAEKAVSLDLEHYESPSFYDMLRRAEREASARPLQIVTQLFGVVRNGVTLCSLAAILVGLHWAVLLLLLAASSPHLFVGTRLARKGYALKYQQTQDSREMGYLSRVLVSLTHFKEIKLFRAGHYLIQRHQTIFRRLYAERKRFAVKQVLGSAGVSSVSAVTYVAFYGYVIYRTLVGHLTVGDLTLYGGAYLQGQAELASLLTNLASLYENGLFTSNLYGFLALRPTVVAPRTPAKASVSAGTCVELKDVWFRYPGTDRWVLRGLTMRLTANETVGIVGANGAGKTTLVKLFCRLYDPQRGEILLDGKNIASLDPHEYRRLIGAIFQDFGQYELTAQANIGLGCVEHIHDAKRVRDAALKSGVDEAIRRLPKEYGSVLGRLLENGHQLSIGEWQRVAIARAIMRDSKILVLDEPTSALDARSEHETFGQLKELAKGKICMFVSHRFSTVRLADKIYVLDRGRVAEQGSHEELLELDAKYADLYSMQASKYVC